MIIQVRRVWIYSDRRRPDMGATLCVTLPDPLFPGQDLELHFTVRIVVRYLGRHVAWFPLFNLYDRIYRVKIGNPWITMARTNRVLEECELLEHLLFRVLVPRRWSE